MSAAIAAKHTPGPWVAVPRNRSSLKSVPDDAWAIMHPGKDGEPCDIGIIEAHENNEDNAALISLAPDMMAAIESWHEHWDNLYDGEPLKDHEVKLLASYRAAKGL